MRPNSWTCVIFALYAQKAGLFKTTRVFILQKTYTGYYFPFEKKNVSFEILPDGFFYHFVYLGCLGINGMKRWRALCVAFLSLFSILGPKLSGSENGAKRKCCCKTRKNRGRHLNSSRSLLFLNRRNENTHSRLYER